ncbi:MAG: glycosyltransferase [bacterium]|nr:glycosyltransferase [bacterium]
MMNVNYQPVVSIIIPVKPGGYVKALESLNDLDYPAEKLEVLIAEGTQPSRQRNEAAKKASGDILYFLDDDSSPVRSNMNLLVAHYKDDEVACVGGPSITPDTDRFMQRCFGLLLCSPFGGGGIRNRYQRRGGARESSDSELILCNLSFRADLYKTMGGLNEKLYPNEENELMSRIQSAGLKLIHDPDIYVLRSQRVGLWAFARQMFNYGRGRMEQTIISPSSASAIHFVPALFVAYLAGLSVISSHVYMIPILCYIMLNLIFSLKTATGEKRYRAKRLVVVFFLFPLMHIAYGIGTFYGLKSLIRCSPKKIACDIRVKKLDIFVKE